MMEKMIAIFNKWFTFDSNTHAGDLEMFDELWAFVKAGIIVCFLTMAVGLISGLLWGYIGRFF